MGWNSLRSFQPTGTRYFPKPQPLCTLEEISALTSRHWRKKPKACFKSSL